MCQEVGFPSDGRPQSDGVAHRVRKPGLTVAVDQQILPEARSAAAELDRPGCAPGQHRHVTGQELLLRLLEPPVVHPISAVRSGCGPIGRRILKDVPVTNALVPHHFGADLGEVLDISLVSHSIDDDPPRTRRSIECVQQLDGLAVQVGTASPEDRRTSIRPSVERDAEKIHGREQFAQGPLIERFA